MLGSPYALFIFSVFTWRLFAITDPYTLPLPPFKSFSIRLRALLSPAPSKPEYAKFPLKNRLFLLFRAVWFLLMSPFWIFLWTIDDLIFAGYKDVEVRRRVRARSERWKRLRERIRGKAVSVVDTSVCN